MEVDCHPTGGTRVTKFALYFTGQLPQDGSRSAEEEYRLILDLAAEGEALGFDSVWLSEHHFAGDSYLPSIFPILAAMAARTSTIELGAGVVLAAFNHPIRLAEDATVVDLLSGGRLILGLGLGWRDEEFRVFQVAREGRAHRLEDAVSIVRAATANERFSYTGRTIQVEDCRIMPRPLRQLPVWIAAALSPALRRVGRMGDGYIGGFLTPDDFAERLAVVDEAAREAGRSETLPAAILVDVWPGETTEAVRRGAWAATDIYKVWHADGDTPARPLALPDHPADEAPPLLVSGDPATVAGRIQQYVSAAGERELTMCLRFAFPGVERESIKLAMTRFVESVGPAIGMRAPARA
jgi:alkanesulfonate monooxygenase SsuD/methylene tetrahydromethanopterin reductase-like flavin-dependent oxidoreductase (luciferase family)